MALKLWVKLTRRKTVTPTSLEETKLARILSTLDLTLMGIGSTLGVGIYVLAGQVARETAGPAVAISFLIAAVASAFAGVCYAEFGARVPRAGSAYVYSYYTVGEFVAFLIGWNLILEYIIGAASVTKGISTYVDALVDNKIGRALEDLMPIYVDFLGSYPDFFAFAVVTIFSVLLAFGMKESSKINNVCTAINMGVVIFVVIGGAINANSDNWKIPAEKVPPGAGEGGFAPFGFAGVIKGAATCFYGFIGFDCVATTGEEAKTPQKSIPLAIVSSLSVIFAAYFSVSVVLTLMWPYYLQDVDAPLTFVFDQIGWPAAKWVVTVGALFALLPSLLGSLYPLPRIIYAMANDGLIFEPLGTVNERFRSPVVGTLLAGVLTGVMALVFNLSQLVNMMSIGTLLAYTIVAASVLMLRYRKSDTDQFRDPEPDGSLTQRLSCQLFNSSGLKNPTKFSSELSAWLITAYCVFSLISMSCVRFLAVELDAANWWVLLVIVLSLFMALMTLIMVGCQPPSKEPLPFKTPLVPVIPGLSIMVNLYLMLTLDNWTWIRFAVWIVIGIFIYFLYGIRHSKENYSTTPSFTDSQGNNSQES